MSGLRRLFQRVRAMFTREALDDEFDEEIRSHIELATDDFVARGHSGVDAARLARAKFGLTASALDAHRQARSLAWIDALRFDTAHAWRSLWNARAFALTVIATMTVAISLNTSVFVVMDAVLFRGFPLVRDHDRVLFLQEQGPQGACCVSYLDFEDWQARSQSFQGMAFVRSQTFPFRDSAGRPSDVGGTQLSSNAFAVLGVAPILGRDFLPADEGGAPVVILSYRFWQARFDGRTDVIGATVHVADQPATVIGVMPEHFEFPLRINGNFWMPVAPGPQLRTRGLANGGFTVLARLRDGVTREQAQADIEAINQQLAMEHPDTNRKIHIRMASHAEWNSGKDARLIWGSLWVASCLVLLIACANLVNLTLVRTSGRGRELATKLALGAGHLRIVHQLTIEVLTLDAIAAAIAWWLVKWTVGRWDLITFSVYQVLDYRVDSRALVYLLGVAALSAVLMAGAPIIGVLWPLRGDALKGGTRGVTIGRPGKRLGNALVALQMALAIVLLAGAGVLVRSFQNIVGAELGVRGSDNVLVGMMRMPTANYAKQDDRVAYLDRLQSALVGASGVEQVALASSSPMKFAATRLVEFEGRPRSPDDELIGFVRASASYLPLIGARVLDGRAFSDADRPDSQPVAIVNQAFADKYWPGQSPVGRRIRHVVGRATGDWRVVVGVTSNIMHNDPLRQSFRPVVYVPLMQEPQGLTIFWFARTIRPATQMASSIRPAAESVDPTVSLETFSSLTDSFAFDRDFMDAEHSELGKHAKVAPIFAVIAMVLSGLGLIAVVGYSVDQRRKEIGIRMAVGASTSEIRRLILREGLTPVLCGLMAGVAAAAGANQLLRSQLVAVSPNDPVVLIGAPIALLTVAFLATQLPLRRATAVDPVIALRAD